MRKLISFLILILFTGTFMAQTTTLTFTGRDANNHFIPLDREGITDIKIFNSGNAGENMLQCFGKGKQYPITEQ